MCSASEHTFRSTSVSLRHPIALVSMLVLGMALSGCAQAVEPTIPPATVYGPHPATAAGPGLLTPTPVQPTVTPVPTATPLSRTLLSPTSVPSPNPEPLNTVAQAKPVSLTILHTNDVKGEIDPCG